MNQLRVKTWINIIEKYILYLKNYHKRNEHILTELQMSQITEFIWQYRKNWKEHVDRMSSDRIPKMILKY
jgi:hypothetical protein